MAEFCHCCMFFRNHQHVSICLYEYGALHVLTGRKLCMFQRCHRPWPGHAFNFWTCNSVNSKLICSYHLSQNYFGYDWVRHFGAFMHLSFLACIFYIIFVLNWIGMILVCDQKPSISKDQPKNGTDSENPTSSMEETSSSTQYLLEAISANYSSPNEVCLSSWIYLQSIYFFFAWLIKILHHFVPKTI